VYKLPLMRFLFAVTIKLIAAIKDERPIRCNERITKSMVKDERADKGGYKVHALLQPMPLEQD